MSNLSSPRLLQVLWFISSRHCKMFEWRLSINASSLQTCIICRLSWSRYFNGNYACRSSCYGCCALTCSRKSALSLTSNKRTFNRSRHYEIRTHYCSLKQNWYCYERQKLSTKIVRRDKKITFIRLRFCSTNYTDFCLIEIQYWCCCWLFMQNPHSLKRIYSTTLYDCY
jgi:hypothetical protein